MRRPIITLRSTSLPPQAQHKEKAQERVYEDHKCDRKLIDNLIEKERITGPRMRTTSKNAAIPRKPVKVPVVAEEFVEVDVAKSMPLRRVGGRQELKVVVV